MATKSVSDETDMAEGGECSPVEGDTMSFSHVTHVFDPESTMRTASTSKSVWSTGIQQTKYQLHEKGKRPPMDLGGA